MNHPTSIAIDIPTKPDNGLKANNKNINGNQSKATVTARSFGRELSNFEAQGESSGDNSKGNVQNVVNYKENFYVPGRASAPAESGSEKVVVNNKQLQDNMKSQQSKSTQNSDEETDREELCSADKERENDPQFVVNYVREIFDNLRESEEKCMPQHGYLKNVQSDVNEKMRAILVDWLVDVHIRFKLLPETLFLTVNIVDRYLELNCVPRQRLQLVGTSAMLIASKYEEIYPPEVKEFEYITDRAYTREEILEMEGKIINSLQFTFTTTSSLRFLERYGLVSQLDEKMLNLAKYLLELALVDYKMLKYSPSTIACSAIYLINKINKRDGWSDTMVKEAKYEETQLRPCAKELCVLLQGASKYSLQAVRRKFASAKYMQVSKIQLDML